MNEQRVKDLIEHLKQFDGDTRISSPVEFKWNPNRTALYTLQESKVIGEREGLLDEIAELKEEVRELDGENDKLDSELGELKSENAEMKRKLEKISNAL